MNKEIYLEYSGSIWEILLRQCCPQDDENSMVGEIFTGPWMLLSALRCEWGCQPGGCIYTLRACPCSVPPQAKQTVHSHFPCFSKLSVFCNPHFWFLQGPCIILSHCHKLSSVALTLIPISFLFMRKLHEHLQSFSVFGCLLWPILTWVFHMNYDPVAICIVLTLQFLKKNPITFQFLLIVFNSLWKPFQLFIIHFFSALTAEQNLYFFPALYGFSPCFDCSEALSSWALPPLLFMCWFGRKMRLWSGHGVAVRGRGRRLHLSCAFRIVSCSLPLLRDRPLTTAGHQPALHPPASRCFPVPQLDWHGTPCSFLKGYTLCAA